jgi:hypothetical protein
LEQVAWQQKMTNAIQRMLPISKVCGILIIFADFS